MGHSEKGTCDREPSWGACRVQRTPTKEHVLPEPGPPDSITFLASSLRGTGVRARRTGQRLEGGRRRAGIYLFRPY
uniref:Uncharacterized protein n=1 Tax=Hyaloperonospora arabidopsidis (strain Emoy2) TaxID=559515 RepID=M4BTS7_HYAAE